MVFSQPEVDSVTTVPTTYYLLLLLVLVLVVEQLLHHTEKIELKRALLRKEECNTRRMICDMMKKSTIPVGNRR